MSIYTIMQQIMTLYRVNSESDTTYSESTEKDENEKNKHISINLSMLMIENFELYYCKVFLQKQIKITVFLLKI